MTYIDGFVFPVPTAHKEKLRAYAQKVDVLFKKHGALQVIEAWGEDVPKGKTTDFYRAVNAKADETIMFSWIMWPDKVTREAGNEKVFAEIQEMGEEAMTLPFDGKRMIYGGFNTLIEL